MLLHELGTCVGGSAAAAASRYNQLLVVGNLASVNNNVDFYL